MLSFQNVTKDFHLDVNTTITPVKNVTINIDQGEFIVIVGRSGTGKTTLLNLAAGLVKTTSGEVLVDNKNLGDMKDKQLSELRSRKMGFVFQFPSLLPSFTILENVIIPAIFFNNKTRKEACGKAMEILGMLDLSGKKDVYPKQLSAGEQKRVVIARSLINSPEIILADEPTSDLDNQTEKEVMSLLKEVNTRGVTLLVVTHNLQLLPFATRSFNMEHGYLDQIVRVGAG
jgi:putative ABC transport system ATP-binding protein